MGLNLTKSPLERRNTVLRRSQRKSIHGTKSKADKIIKDIKKFKGIEEDANYLEIKAKIEAAERDLKIQEKNLQPQVRHIYDETLKKTQNCYQFLEDKLKENQGKAEEKNEEAEDKKDEESDEVFEPQSPKSVDLRIVQVESIEASPQVNKRASVMKIGVPVMPGTILESLNRDSQVKIPKIREELEKLEYEISQFVGKRNGRYYDRIKRQLERNEADLKGISVSDDEIAEQVKQCHSYVMSCLSFLDEKAVDDGDDDDYDEVENVRPVTGTLSPTGSMRTTYI